MAGKSFSRTKKTKKQKKQKKQKTKTGRQERVQYEEVATSGKGERVSKGDEVGEEIFCG